MEGREILNRAKTAVGARDGEGKVNDAEGGEGPVKKRKK